MNDDYDYEQQQKDEENQRRWEEALAMSAALEEHRKWKAEFFANLKEKAK